MGSDQVPELFQDVIGLDDDSGSQTVEPFVVHNFRGVFDVFCVGSDKCSSRIVIYVVRGGVESVFF